MYLPDEIAKSIINLNPYPDLNIIDQELADRQFRVIVKGFNYLLHPDNSFLYLGDEVGLGKTYIALGIASLMRLYSNNRSTYTDTILVPKENLQYKWQKEIRNFISNNYLRIDNIVKSVLGQPVGNLGPGTIKKSLGIINEQISQYVIYRNSSFSIASESDEESNTWIDKLKGQLPDDQQQLFKKIAGKFKRNPIMVKRAFAYLLNHKLPEIDLLIVDEAHNFKHGIGDEVSIRNQIVSRIFGANMEDVELSAQFPELVELAKPKVKKLLLLSATPINNSLSEIKNQLDCFLNHHRFKGFKNDEHAEQKINDVLNEFMIRGVMTIKINEKPYSRNGYRHEHRKGNVKMNEYADYQLITDNSTALVLCLMQNKTIKELKLKSNNQFEMGLLAGFESFNKTKSIYEDDTLENRKVNEAKDEIVLKELIDSYYSKFNDYPPHPKQESLVDELFSLLINRTKALVFVRRIASVRELERKLLKRYSDYLIEKIIIVSKGSKVPSIKVLLENYKEEHIRDKIESTIDLLADRIVSELGKEYSERFNGEYSVDKSVPEVLRAIYDSPNDDPNITEFKVQIRNHKDLIRIKEGLKILATGLIKRIWNNQLLLKEEDEEDEENTVTEPIHDEEKSPYFFQWFFYSIEGKKYKNRSFKKDWHELNLLLFNDRYNLFRIDLEPLSKEYEFFIETVDILKFQEITKIILQAIKSKEISNAIVKDEFRLNTFFTELLLDLCESEFSIWVNKHKYLIYENYYSRFLDELDTLVEILKSIFRQGSGIIPAFIAEAKTSKKFKPREEFIREIKILLTGEFDFVLNEIKQIILDYDKLVERNFDDINKIRYNLIQQLPITGQSGQHDRDVRKTAIQFRMPGYPYILITTDILKEGEDLHSYCKNIYHYGIAWNPSDMEQRTGRIDRIDSLAYRSLKEIEGKEIEGIPFVNKLQVFYPYLADTLEVNQMIRLFKGMDRFIEIFYNDLSAKMEKNSKANVDEVLLELDLPKQRSGLLESKYEYTSFKFNPEGDSFQIIDRIGISFEELLDKMENLLYGLRDYNFFINPEFDKKSLIISGVMNLAGRQGSFRLYYEHKPTPGIFTFKMESVLGRIQVFGKSSYKTKMQGLLKIARTDENLDFELKESNSYLFVTLNMEFDSEIEKISNTLYKLIRVVDNIEKEVTNQDEKIEL